jgi:hypothetical protein
MLENETVKTSASRFKKVVRAPHQTFTYFLAEGSSCKNGAAVSGANNSMIFLSFCSGSQAKAFASARYPNLPSFGQVPSRRPIPELQSRGFCKNIEHRRPMSRYKPRAVEN